MSCPPIDRVLQLVKTQGHFLRSSRPGGRRPRTTWARCFVAGVLAVIPAGGALANGEICRVYLLRNVLALVLKGSGDGRRDYPRDLCRTRGG
jgi:hypothetical protein